ncbi:MAG: zinc ribbon domain-containing protein [Elusimicrobia bacterium]|nr:zinc ribbon domain-containing protein [Elusimicrobiota bacterium]
MPQARILCAKCGAASSEARPDCAHCGGRNVRVCAACGFQNSVAKNFCDRCGRPSGFTPAVPPVASAAPDPRAPPMTLLATAVPPARAAVPPPPPDGAPRPRGLDARRRAGRALVALAAVAAGAALLKSRQEARRPEAAVPRLAAQYLDALRAGDYGRAYGFFSDAAKAACGEEEFRASRGATPWSWSKPSVAHQEPGAVLIAYDLQTQDAPVRRDHLLFVLEKGRWVRPYNWTLMRKVEAAFDRNDPESGRAAAEEAAAINPRDPMAWGYLCETSYYRKAYGEAERRCRRALSLARVYPSNLTPKSLYHLRAILADAQKNALGRPDLALEQFAAMLDFPDASSEDQCQILLARAEAYLQLRRRNEAAADLARANALCARPTDRADLARMGRTLDR